MSPDVRMSYRGQGRRGHPFSTKQTDDPQSPCPHDDVDSCLNCDSTRSPLILRLRATKSEKQPSLLLLVRHNDHAYPKAPPKKATTTTRPSISPLPMAPVPMSWRCWKDSRSYPRLTNSSRPPKRIANAWKGTAAVHGTTRRDG